MLKMIICKFNSWINLKILKINFTNQYTNATIIWIILKVLLNKSSQHLIIYISQNKKIKWIKEIEILNKI